MENSLKRLAIIINLTIETNQNSDYVIPISHIDGLPVDVFLVTWCQKNGMTLRIGTDNAECAYRDNEYEYQSYHLWSKQFHRLENETPVELTTRVLQYAHETIPTLRFDKYSGVLTNEPHTNEKPELFQELFACETIKLCFDRCSVCHDLTRCSTKCNHYLCHMCFSGIKRVNDDTIGEEIKKCPICRETILM